MTATNLYVEQGT